MNKFAAALAGIVLAATATSATAAGKLVMDLKCGPVIIELRSDIAPKHAQQLTSLASQGFYDGIIFHRVINGFMAQTGDPTGTGMGGSDLPDIPAEFSNVPFERGTVGMARSSNPNSANSQFFIMFTKYPSLDGNYTVVGNVTSGMDCIDQINKGEPPASPDQIIKMSVQ